MEKILEIKNLAISFRTNNGNVQAVRDISFDVCKGETIAVVGESGSGKSVTARAIMGILAPNAIIEGGSILYNGKDLLKISEKEYCSLRGRKISMVFQDPLSSLNPIMKVGKQITETMLLNGKMTKKEAKERGGHRFNDTKRRSGACGKIAQAHCIEEVRHNVGDHTKADGKRDQDCRGLHHIGEDGRRAAGAECNDRHTREAVKGGGHRHAAAAHRDLGKDAVSSVGDAGKKAE